MASTRRWQRARVVAPLLLAFGLVLVLAPTQSTAQSTPGGPSSSFKVTGDISQPVTYRLADLKALPAYTLDVSFEGPGGVQSHQFTGALLYDVETAAAPNFDSVRKNDVLRWTARVRATGNYEAVVAFGEFDPGFEGKQVLLAYAENGQPLTDTGFARLVVPGDSKGGRYVSNVNLIAFDPPPSGPAIDIGSLAED